MSQTCDTHTHAHASVHGRVIELVQAFHAESHATPVQFRSCGAAVSRLPCLHSLCFLSSCSIFFLRISGILLRLVSARSGGLRLAGDPPDAQSAREHQWKYRQNRSGTAEPLGGCPRGEADSRCRWETQNSNAPLLFTLTLPSVKPEGPVMRC